MSETTLEEGDLVYCHHPQSIDGLYEGYYVLKNNRSSTSDHIGVDTKKVCKTYIFLKAHRFTLLLKNNLP